MELSAGLRSVMGKNQFLFIVANKMFLMIIDKGETHNYQHNTELPSSFNQNNGNQENLPCSNQHDRVGWKGDNDQEL